MHARLLVFAVFHCILGHTLLYQQTALNPMETFVKSYIQTSLNTTSNETINWYWSSISASFPIGRFFGSLSIHLCSQYLGSRFTATILSNILHIIGALLQFFAFGSVSNWYSVAMAMAGRFMTGVSMATTMYLSVYVVDCCPVEQRGLVGMLVSVGIPFWNTMSIAAGLPKLLGEKDRWYYSLLVPVAPAVVHLLLGNCFPESPSELYVKQGDRNSAQAAIDFYSRPSSEELKQSAQEALHRDSLLSKTNKGIFWQMLTVSHLRRSFLLCLVANVGYRFGGMDIALQYSSTVIGNDDNTVLYTLLIVYVPSILAAGLGTLLTRCMARRPHFLLVLFGNVCAISLLFTAELLNKHDLAAWVSLTGLFLVLSSDMLGVTTIARVLPSEICPQQTRSLTSGVSQAASGLLSILVVLTFPPLREEGGFGKFVLLPMVLGAVGVFVFFVVCMPETHEKHVHETVGRWMGAENEYQKKVIKAVAGDVPFGRSKVRFVSKVDVCPTEPSDMNGFALDEKTENTVKLRKTERDYY